MTRVETLGIEIGPSGIKGAPLSLASGQLSKERMRVATHDLDDPAAVADGVREVVEHFAWTGWVGCAIPGVVKDGTVHSSPTLSRRWRGLDAQALFERRTHLPFTVLNDTDAVGVAEMRYGAGRDRPGTVLLVDLGFTIGCAVFNNGVLVPNVDIRRLEVGGVRAERRASLQVRDRRSWSWKRWARGVDAFLRRAEQVLWPDLNIIGGPAGKKVEKFVPHLDLRAEIQPAQLRGEAGIIGAALVAG